MYSDSCSISSEDLGIPRLIDDHLGIFLKGTVSVISSDPPCPIHNGTLKSFVRSNMYSNEFIILKTDYYYFKSGLSTKVTSAF